MGKWGWLKRAGALCVFSIAAAVISAAQSFNVIVNFNGANGGGPDTMSLAQGLDGDFYGTTNTGGAHGYGTVFKVTPAGELTTLYSFCAQAGCTDGASTYAGLILGTDGNFYGVTTYGGTNGWGTVFKITPGGVLTALHSIEAAEGFYPLGPLVQASDGNFYGTVASGGANDDGGVFQITPQGVLTNLHSFNGTDGSDPSAALVEGADGNLYGTTFSGGSSTACEDGCGTVFRVTPGGTLTTLHSFEFSDGAYPYAKLIQANDGNFYGTTNGGGAPGWGTVFRMTPAGALTTLHTFNLADGGRPYAGLLQALNGNFYGTTRYGGADDVGTAFEMTSGGAFTLLHSLDNADGADPSGGLLQATNGTFYGSAWGGGADGDGTLFSEGAGLGPFVMTVPAAREVGQSVIILGTNLSGATSLRFNAIAATFRVVSDTEITTTVPVGATSGRVQVITPGGTLLSNTLFRVMP
jgi:uncharacterized repeat protein (TIGR03803 family)